jgi:hypothetical protein
MHRKNTDDEEDKVIGPTNEADTEQDALTESSDSHPKNSHGIKLLTVGLTLVLLYVVVIAVVLHEFIPVPAGVSIALAATAAAITLLVGMYRDILSATPWPRQIPVTLGIVLAVLSIVTVVGLVPLADQETSTSTQHASSPITSSSQDPYISQVGQPVPTPLVEPSIPVTPNHPCPAPGTTERREPDVEICVVYWCMAPIKTASGDGSITTSQVKVRPKIENNSTQPLDLSISTPSAMRLLVSFEGEYRWDPPSLTANAGDRVVRVIWEGKTFWAVPPNVPHDASVIYLPDGSATYDGFVTSWNANYIEPGGAMSKPLRLGVDGAWLGPR